MASADVKEIISKTGIESVTKTTEALEKSYLALQDNIAGYKALNDVIAKSKGMGDLSKNIEASSIAQEKLKQAVLRTEQATLKLEQARQQAFAKEEARQAKLLALENKQKQADEARLRRIADIEVRETARAQREEANRQQELATSQQITAEQANEATARGRANIERERTASATQRTALEIEQERQANIANVRELRNNAREQNAARGSLEQRRLALIRLRSVFDNLNESERNSPFGQRLATVIPQLNEQVLNLERSTGRSQRNVGNYFGAIQQGASRAFSALRGLANFLPGIGLAGLIGLAVEPIVEAISKMDMFKAKISEVAAAGGAISSEYKKATSDVTALGTSLEEFKQGTISKKELVDRFNESIGQTVGKLKSAEEIEQFYIEKSAAYIQATLLRAQAQAALSIATEKNSEALKRQIEGPTFVDKVLGWTKAIVSFSGASVANAQATKRQMDEVKELGDESGKAAAEYKKLQKAADDFAKQNGFNFRTKVNEAKGIDPAIQARKNAAALIQIQIDTVKQQAEIYKEQADNENFSIESRFEAQERYQERLTRLTQLESQKSKAEKKTSAEEIKAIEAKQQLDESKVISDGVKQRNKIMLDGMAEAERLRVLGNQRSLTLLGKQRDEELTALILAYQNSGNYTVKAQEELEKKRLDIINKYNLQEVYAQIEQAKKLIEIREAQGIDVEKQTADLAGLELKSKELEIKIFSDANDKKLEKAKQNAEKLKEVAQEVFNFARGLTSQLFEGNIANLEEEARIREENKNLQLENIAESTLSEKEKAEQTAIINAQAEQDQARIDAKIREQKRKQAVADKAFALAQIAINTAVAISKALAQTGVLGAFVIPGIIALGAIQAATVLAQPIPKFAKGGVMQKDGFAEYGHGRELRINPDGKTSLTSDTPEIGFVKKGTRFISAPETKRLMAKPDRYEKEGNSWDIAPLLASNKELGKKLDKSISRISINSTIVTERGFNSQSGRMNKINAYISKNFSRN